MIDDGANGGRPLARAVAGASAAAAGDRVAAAAALVARAETLLDDPIRAEQPAAAAAAMLQHAGDDPDGRTFALLFRAFAAILRCRRAPRRLGEAAEIVRQAQPYLLVALPVSVERATLLAGVAQVRVAQRRLDEAAGLFVHAARMFGEAGSRQGEAACRAQAGMVLAGQLDPRPARFELVRAFALMDAGLAPALAARVGVVLAWCESAIGRHAQARVVLDAARALYDRAPEAGEELCRAWWEARIAARRGDGGDGDDAPDAPDAPDADNDADARLDAVRRRLTAEGSIGEAARCTLDLLVHRVEAGRLDGIADLGPALLHAFHRQAALRPAGMIDLLASLALERSSRYRPALGAIRHYLAGIGTCPGDPPDLIPTIEALADRLLVRAARQGLALAHDWPS
jgi:hypothetical protein